MSNEKIHQPASALGTSVPSAAPSLTDAETNRQFGESKAPEAADQPRDAGAPTPQVDERKPNVGSVRAPTGTDEIEDRPDKSLYDRLADKDVTPTERSGGA